MPINREIKISMDVSANAEKAKQELDKLSEQLKKLTSDTQGKNKLGLSKELTEVTNKVRELQAILNSSKNATGGLDLSKLNQNLKSSQTNLQSYAKTLSSLGPDGQRAFAQLANQINAAEIPLKRTNKLMNELKVTLMNTAKWQVSSTLLHGFMGSVQTAIGYVEDLNKSLTNIQIVTGHSSDYMANFAKQANAAAQSLSASTRQYADAALIFYQQGMVKIN